MSTLLHQDLKVWNQPQNQHKKDFKMLMNFPVSFESPSELPDWDILSVHLYMRIMAERKTSVGREEYDIFLEKFSGDKESLDAWIYRLTKLYENEFNKRHEN